MINFLNPYLRAISFVAATLPIASGCSHDAETSSTLAQTARGKVGVLLASHGDIDDVAELEDYIKVAFQKNVGIPLPSWVRGPITDPAYRLSVGTVRAQYDIIGATEYRGNAAKQIAAVNAALLKLGVPGKAYFGANFAHPYISETLDQMRADGVDTILVFNKGAQFSYASSGENMDDVLEYLNEHKDWDAQAIGTFSYSEDIRFRETFATAIERDIQANFAGVPPQDVCILIGSHGLPKWLTDKGDPAIRQMLRTVDWLKTRLPDYPIYHGFLNDDFFPGATWASPNSEQTAETMQGDACPNVLMDGRLSFTTHHRATLYDLNFVARGIFENPDLGPDGQPHPLWVKPKVVLAPNFDDDAGYAQLMAELALDALTGKGELLTLKEKGKGAQPDGTASTPGNFAKDFEKYTWPN